MHYYRSTWLPSPSRRVAGVYRCLRNLDSEFTCLGRQHVLAISTPKGNKPGMIVSLVAAAFVLKSHSSAEGDGKNMQLPSRRHLNTYTRSVKVWG
jgi:hypothetical protein